MQSCDLICKRTAATPLPLVQASLEIPTIMRAVVRAFYSLIENDSDTEL